MMYLKNILTIIAGVGFCAKFANAQCDKGAVTVATFGGVFCYVAFFVICSALAALCCIKQGKISAAGIKSYYNRTIVKVTFILASVLSTLTSILVGYFALAQDDGCWTVGGAYGLGVAISSGYFAMYHFSVGCSRFRYVQDEEKVRIQSSGQVNSPSYNKLSSL